MSFWLSTQVGDAIPDSGDLHARYDSTALSLSDGSSVSTFPDETGNGFDLTAGAAPTFRTNVKNGNAIVRFDGVDDYLTSDFTAVAQPVHHFLTFKFNSTGSFDTVFDGSPNGTERQKFGLDDTPDNWRIQGNTVLDGGSIDTNWHIGALLFNGTSSVIRIDGVDAVTGDAGTDGLGGLILGADTSIGGFADLDVGEFLIYTQDKSSVQTDVESYLNDKWAVF